MKKTYFSRHQGPFIYFLGPSLIVVTILLMFFLRNTAFYLPNPIAPLTLIIIFTATLGGYKPGLLTAAFAAICLAYNLSIPGQHFAYHPMELRRLIAWCISYPIIALVVGLLKNRSEFLLEQELERRIQQEEDLRASEVRMRAIIDSAYDAFVAIDKNSKIQEWNPQAERTFGWTREEALGRALIDLIVPEKFHQAHHVGLTRYLATGEGAILNRRIEVPARHKNGTILAMELTVYPIQQKDSLWFGAFLHDISERKRIEQLSVIQLTSSQIMSENASLNEVGPLLLKELCQGSGWILAELWLFEPTSQSFYCPYVWSKNKETQSLFESQNPKYLSSRQGWAGAALTSDSPQWMIDIDKMTLPRSEILRSAGFKTMLYSPIYDRDELIGVLAMYHSEALKQDARLMSVIDDFCKRLGLYITRIRSEEGLKNLSHDLERKIQERTEELKIVNQQLKNEAVEKEILYEQARTANRLKDEFLATISHELRTPMNVILGHSELLHEENLSPQDQKRSIEAIYRNTKAQVHIVSDILDVSKFITGKVQMNMEVVDLAELIPLAVESISQAASAKDIEITDSISTDVGLITGDPTRLQQVFWNLLSNAVKFTPRHGKIHISLTAAESNVVITVKDNGKGIDPTFLPYVFERFRQEDSATTRKFGGLGLGLAITKNIVEAHGGNIQVTSEGKGLGSTFSVILPLTSLRSHPTTDDTLEDVSHLLDGVHILVVDDQADALSLVATVLKRAGARVDKASSATEAFKKVVRVRPDVLISDIGMPEKDGYDLIGMVRKLPQDMGGETLAIALTAYAQEEDQKKTLQMGFQAHLAKPVEGKQLVRAVAKLVGKYAAH
ncbi:hypothetical protein AZI86_00135 [Bdellovibrio bacteriovorus]|uniref:histidine kinase n=1 Tax=Bdellovibrio bacteriovorus TaxID=959 RepID=A0A150WM02_BDEBC|nr:ATP-binding protein [Bdellovibrio bacteriovorus]KYG65523.1 hypothetical protein AZI86_00135 [Bdellovibrio bacteriovorus]